MFQTITALNFIIPTNEAGSIDSINLRGYSASAYLTGQFTGLIKDKTITPLSVSDIADTFCESGRDLYYKKGIKRPKGVRQRNTWGGLAGGIVENSIFESIEEFKGKNGKPNYQTLKDDVTPLIERIKTQHIGDFKKLNQLMSTKSESSEWLLNLISQNYKMEYVFKNIHKLLSSNEPIEIGDIDYNDCELMPTPFEIGINKNASPDFIIEKWKAIGDIKSGIKGFQDSFLLTCAGYALAYENYKKNGSDINYGIIHFFPTRFSRYAKPISFSQIYIFVIDDEVRDYFLQTRNRAYDIIINEMPGFPENKVFCTKCRYLHLCREDGLNI